MLCYDVTVNGQHVALAGVHDWKVLDVNICALRELRDDDLTSDLRLHIGALCEPDNSDECYHVRWAVPKLAVGSEILIKVVGSQAPDDPIRRYRSDSKVQENPFTDEEMREMRHQSYLELKAEFEAG